MNDTVLVTRTADNPSIAVLTFNRPAVFNAMNDELIEAFREAAVSLANTPGIRALIVRGEGKAFLAGGDVSYFFRAKDDPNLAARVKQLGDLLHEGTIALREAPYPVIACIQGACAGAGLSVAMACDFAIASETASFNSAYTKIGTSPDGGSTWFLPRVVGMKKATELIMLADNISAQEAMSLGLVNRVVPPDALEATVNALAMRLASGATVAYANAKKLINQSYATAIKAHLDDEIALFARATQTADFKEGVTAFVEKRKPVFQGQ
jgi:2-(1,2-epoxy-1,2-dihydrophenyl)acetyl-CoA isomerase